MIESRGLEGAAHGSSLVPAGERALQAIGPEGPSSIELIELPVILVALSTYLVAAISEPARSMIGRSGVELVGEPIAKLFDEGERDDVIGRLDALREGVVDFYRVHRHLDEAEHPGTIVTLWLRAIQMSEERMALVEVADASNRPPLVDRLGHVPVDMTVGTVDRDWVVSSLSSDVEDLLGVLPEELVGRRFLGLIAESDVPSLLDADRRVGPASSASLRVRLRDRKGNWLEVRCVLSALTGIAGRCFILFADYGPAEGSGERTSELEQHLWRIAAEVEASGILHGFEHATSGITYPEMNKLSTRQWEIVSRLMRGERVPTIAAELFLSPSTVRNHLSSIFRRFGVRNQAQLIALLRYGRTA